MFAKTKYLFLLLLAIMSANAGRAMASPPGSVIGEGKVKSELIYTEQPELDKWTTVHLKAIALNDWPKGKFKVHLKSYGVSIYPAGEDWPIWENMKKGSVLETDFKIRPYVLGSSLIEVNFGLTHVDYYLRLDERGKFVNLLSEENLWKHYGVKIAKDGWMKSTKAQSESLALYNGNYHQIHFKPIIKKDYAEYRKGDITVTISPLPSLNNISKVVVKKLKAFDDKYFKPLLGIEKNSTLYYFDNKQETITWPIKGVENLYSYIDEFSGPKDGYYYAELLIQPQTTQNLLNISIAFSKESYITGCDMNISFIINSDGKMEEFNNNKVPAFEVEK